MVVVVDVHARCVVRRMVVISRGWHIVMVEGEEPLDEEHRQHAGQQRHHAASDDVNSQCRGIIVGLESIFG